MTRDRRIIPFCPTPRLAGVVLLAAALLGLSLLYGGATPMGILLGRLAVAVLGLLAALAAASGGGTKAALWLVAAFGLLAGQALLQSASWPAGFVGLVSPEHARLAGLAREVLAPDETSALLPLSLSPALSRTYAARCLVLGLAVLAACVVCADGSRGGAGSGRRYRRVLMGTIGGTALLQLGLGLVPYVRGEVPRLRGTYVNPDHLATLLEMGFACALGCVLWTATSKRWAGLPDRRAIWVIVATAVVVLTVAGLTLTGSRAALAAVVVAAIVELLFLLGGTDRKRALLALAIPVTGVAGFLAWVGPGRFFERLSTTTLADVAWSERLLVWTDSWDLVRRFPVLGTGLGTFRDAYPMVQRPQLGGTVWIKAHNEYVELLATGGVLGGAVAAFALGWLAWSLRRRALTARVSEDRWFAVAVLGCIAATGVHAAFDFGLSLLGNALGLAALTGAALAIRPGPAAKTAPSGSQASSKRGGGPDREVSQRRSR